MGNPLEREKPQEKTLLVVTGPLAEKNIETQEVTVRGVTYKFPSPEAVENEFLEVLNKMDERDSSEDYLEFRNFIRRLVDTMKEARHALNVSKQQAELKKEVWSKSDLRIALGKFADAQSIMSSQGLEEPKGIKEILDYQDQNGDK